MDKISDILKNLSETDAQRRKWLLWSSVVFIGIAIYIAFWNWIHELENPFIEWSFISVGLVITVNWWYWTMSSLSTLVRCIYTEYTILSEVTHDIEEVKIILKCKSTLANPDCGTCLVSGKCKGH